MKKRTSPTSNRVRRTRNTRTHTPKIRVAPIAERTDETPRVAIPAILEESPNGNEAVIRVEVKRPGKAPRRRAAVIPISVKSRAKTHAANEARETGRGEGGAARSTDAVRWSDPVTDWLVAATRIGEGAIIVASQIGTAAIDLGWNFSRMILSPMIATQRAGEKEDLLEQGTLVAKPRLPWDESIAA